MINLGACSIHPPMSRGCQTNHAVEPTRRCRGCTRAMKDGAMKDAFLSLNDRKGAFIAFHPPALVTILV